MRAVMTERGCSWLVEQDGATELFHAFALGVVGIETAR